MKRVYDYRPRTLTVSGMPAPELDHEPFLLWRRIERHRLVVIDRGASWDDRTILSHTIETPTVGLVPQLWAALFVLPLIMLALWGAP